MKSKIKKAVKIIILVLILLFLSDSIASSTARLELKGLQITEYSHCGQTYGFPFISHGGGEIILLGTDGLHADCFFSTDPLSFFLNVGFWFLVLLGVYLLIRHLFYQIKNRL